MVSPAKISEALELTLHGISLGVVVHFQDDKNQLVFNPDYLCMGDSRPTLTLAQIANSRFLQEIHRSSRRLPAILSNLLPEGVLREWMAKTLKVDVNNEFPMLAYTGSGLPGALIATPISENDAHHWAAISGSPIVNVKPHVPDAYGKVNGFSLAGVQIKFSGRRKGARYNLRQSDNNKWIIKTPSIVHANAPENEYTSMRLAESIGVTIPDIELIQLSQLDNLPDIRLPNEKFAYAIRRFDRAKEDGDLTRIHTEDFAQVFGSYSHEKYLNQNQEMIGAVLYKYSANGLADIQQMARRLVANILIGNGDAHLKNWSLIYPDRIQPVLSPAYDIVATHLYMQDERTLAFKMGRQNDWYKMEMNNFERWSERIGVSWPAVKAHVIDAVEKARAYWPQLLDSLPMIDSHKAKMRKHWANLSDDFRI